MCEQETFWTLFRSLPHWEFELFLSGMETLVINGIIFGVVWPFLRGHWKHHLAHDSIHKETNEK